MATNSRNKEIQVQRPAQSLEHFKTKVARPGEDQANLMKPMLIGAGVVVVALVAWTGIAQMRSRALERHEVAIAGLVHEVESGAPAELEARMRAKLPALEALAKSAPASERAATAGLLASWRLQLEGRAALPAPGDDPWSLLRQAQTALGLGKGAEAQKLLAPLRKGATPQEGWGSLYWSTLMESHRLLGDRDQAWKDLAEYKQRFKDQGDAASLEQLLKGI